jgi:hypothetical protein
MIRPPPFLGRHGGNDRQLVERVIFVGAGDARRGTTETDGTERAAHIGCCRCRGARGRQPRHVRVGAQVRFRRSCYAHALAGGDAMIYHLMPAGGTAQFRVAILSTFFLVVPLEWGYKVGGAESRR